VSARYGGDSVFASSTSNPVSVNVTPEASNLSMFGSYYLYTNGTTGVLANGGTYPLALHRYRCAGSGSECTAGIDDGIATGTATFTDAASTGTVSSGALNVGTASTAVWVPAAFSVGNHSISASYSGDASFNASASTTPLSFTITKASRCSAVGTLICNCARSERPLQLTVAIGSSAPPPTGTATFYSGNTVLGTATLALRRLIIPTSLPRQP